MATFATTRSQRRYTARDLWLLTEVAARLSIAIENVRLYQDLKDTAEDLRRANAAKDEFLSLVSHELRTPITIILGNSRVLTRLRTAVDHDSLMQALDDIHDEAERLNRIIENLLVLARVERGQADLETLHVAHVLEPLIEAHRRQYPRREVRLGVDDDEPLVDGSEFCIEQSVRNLLSNAEKYSPPDAPIDVTISRAGADVVVGVSDRGIGITPEETREIFRPFYRSSQAQAVSGVGIGLTVCERLIQAQGGEIWAEPREGGGTTIAFSLRATAAADEPPEA